MAVSSALGMALFVAFASNATLFTMFFTPSRSKENAHGNSTTNDTSEVNETGRDTSIGRKPVMPENLKLAMSSQSLSGNRDVGLLRDDFSDKSVSNMPELKSEQSFPDLAEIRKLFIELGLDRSGPRRGDLDPTLENEHLRLWYERKKSEIESLREGQDATSDKNNTDSVLDIEYQGLRSFTTEGLQSKYEETTVRIEPNYERETVPASETTIDLNSDNESLQFETTMQQQFTALKQYSTMRPTSEMREQKSTTDADTKTSPLKSTTSEPVTTTSTAEPTTSSQSTTSTPDKPTMTSLSDYITAIVTRFQNKDTRRRLNEVISSLTKSELEQFDTPTVEILIPALRRLERMVLKELERLSEVYRRQAKRLLLLEESRLPEADVMKAVNIIKEEQRLIERQQKKEAKPDAPQSKLNTPNVAVDNNQIDEGSGSGDEMIVSVETVRSTMRMMTMATMTSAPITSDSDIINHINEIYNSISTMEHKVLEVDSKLSTVKSEVFYQRTIFDRVDEKVEEISRNQKNLIMRSTRHDIQIADLEQFKGEANQLLGSAEGTVEQYDTRLEILRDRMFEQTDEMEIMRNVFGRLKQGSNELRSSDSFKGHDLRDLRQAFQQIHTRMNDLYQNLDRSVGNIREDVKTYMDHVCVDNNLQC